jgi:electron transfer flavoprotein beta subunit
VQKISMGKGQLTAERKTEEGIEVVTAPLPAVVTVLPDINIPRIPGVKDTLMAGKKPVTTIGKDELQPVGKVLLQTISLTASRLERNCERFGTEAEDISRFAGILRKFLSD